MTAITRTLFGERSLTNVAALFGDQQAARAAADRLVRTAGMQQAQVRLLSPSDARVSRRDVFGRALEPEQRGIWHTLLRTHVVGGVLGFALGLLVYWAFVSGGNPAVLASPRISFTAIVFLATAFGLMLGGFVALRPDRIALISTVRRALRKGAWVVVAHPVDDDQVERVTEMLADGSQRVLRSL